MAIYEVASGRKNPANASIIALLGGRLNFRIKTYHIIVHTGLIFIII